MPLSPLPIDDQLGHVASALKPPGSTLIVEAPPGAGKTTRLPAHLLDQPWLEGRILVSEPRRIAARLAATRVAEESGAPLGDRVGYQVRFDDKTSATTQLIFMTEGLLLRRILDSPELRGVSAVVLDEVHERSADLDVTMALLQEIRKKRPDLRLVLMSATLDAAPLKDYFPASELLTSEGRSFPVAFEHQSKEDDRRLDIQVRSAVKSTLSLAGDVLVFLPGGAEIRACQSALEQVPDVEVLPLHGDLPLQEQVRALGRSGAKKRIVLSTNIAESSVTIPGVTTVIDSGLARTAVFDPWSGVTRLETRRISQARCIQRAGRAGRVAPGRALRLYTKGSYVSRPEQDPPELLREDLSSTLLMLLAANRTPDDLSFLSPPPSSAWEKAKDLLLQLGALDGDALSSIGREMARLPLPPRLSRVAVEGHRLGITEEACRAAALLAERDIVRASRRGPGAGDVEAGDSDLDDRLDRLDQLEAERFNRRLARDLDVDLRGAQQASKVARSLQKTLGSNSVDSPTDDALTRALLSGFVDRIAERKGRGRELTLASGLQASLHEASCVSNARLLLALSADAPGGKRRNAQVRLACRLEPDWLLDAAPEAVELIDEHVWNTDKNRVDEVSRFAIGKVTLDETRSRAQPSEEATPVLIKAALSKGPAVYDPEERLETLFVRLSVLLARMPEVLGNCSEEERDLFSRLEREGALDAEQFESLALQAAAQSRTSLEELAGADLAYELELFLPSPLGQALKRHVPQQTQLKGGRRLTIHYEKGRDPWVESRLQDFFSMTETPSLCSGRLPLALHLLAPNKRAVQVTTDLAGFWERHYPDLRKQLMRRYPKHLWPEDGSTAQPPQPGRIR